MWTLTIGKTLGQLPRRLFLISSLEFGDIRMNKTEDHRNTPMGNCWMEKFQFLVSLVSACCIDVGGHWCDFGSRDFFLGEL